LSRDVVQRAERPRSLQRIATAPAHRDFRTLPIGQRFQQCCLADAGFPFDENEHARPGCCAPQLRLQLRQQLIPLQQLHPSCPQCTDELQT